MTHDLPRPATPPLPAPVGAFEEVRRRARHRRGTRMAALGLAAVLPVGVAGAAATGAFSGRGADRVDSAGSGEGKCAEENATAPSPLPSAAAATATGGVPGSKVAPPPEGPEDAPAMTGTVSSADGSWLRCVGIYRFDRTQSLRLVARSDRYGRWTAPCLYGDMVAMTFDPYGSPSTDPGEPAWVRIDNPALHESPCAAPVAVRMAPPATVTIRLAGASPDPNDPAHELHLTCDELDPFSGKPLLVLRPREDGAYRASGLGPCRYAISGEGVDELRELRAGEDATWEVPVAVR